MVAKKTKPLCRLFAFKAIPAGMLLFGVPLAGGFQNQPSQTLTANATESLPLPNSMYGDISMSDWQWAQGQAVDEVLEYARARDEYIARGGVKENFEWVRSRNLFYPVNNTSQRLLIIDLGHYDYTEGVRWPTSGSQARDGMTEAEYVDIQGRALFNEAKRMGYRVVFIRAPDEAMRVPEFNDFSMEDRKTYYARTRGAQIDFIAQRLEFLPMNTRAVSIHMDRSAGFENENPDRLRGTAIHVNAHNDGAIQFARAVAVNIPHQFIAPYVRHNDGIEYTTTLALPKGAVHVPTVLFESEFMSDHPIAMERRYQIRQDNGASWARWFMRGIENSFPPRAQQIQTQIASNAVAGQSQNLR